MAKFRNTLMLFTLMGCCAHSQEPTELGEHGFTTGDVKIHYVTAGKGPLVVMIHGFPDYWYSWREQMPAIANTHKVVAIDQRGYNFSDKPEGVENYKIEKLVGDVKGVIEHVGRKKAIVIGHDWGGMVAWSFAAMFPEMTEKLVVLNLPHPNGLRRELANNPEQQRNSQYARDFQKPDAASNLQARLLTFWIKDSKVRKKYIAAFQRSSFEGMLNYYKANYPHVPYEESNAAKFPRIKCPVLLIHGLKDKALHASGLNNTWEWIDNELTILTVPNADHFVQQDAPERVTKAIVQFLD